MSPSDETKPPPTAWPEIPDPDAPPTEEELRASEKLRGELDQREPGSAAWDFAESIRAAASPAQVAPGRQREIVAAALAHQRGRVVYLAFGGAVSLAAMAAAVALIVRQPAPEASARLDAPAAPIAVSRSTASLFPQGIPVSGGTSDRVDRIAYARAQDLRENRFAQWGVR